MVLLVERLSRSLKLSPKLDNHHHPSEALSASLQAFQSDVSTRFHQLSLNSKPGSESMSLPWIQQCFELIPIVNKAFAKLVVDIDYPVTKWEGSSIEEYLNYTLNLLELLNSITSSLSHLCQARLSLSHALGLFGDSPSLSLKEIQLKNVGKFFELEGIGEREERVWSRKEWVVHEALLVMKSTGFWICVVALSGLCSDVKPYMKLRKGCSGSDSVFCREMMEKRGIVKEVKEVNEAVDCLVAAMANGKCDDSGKELKRRLEVLEKGLKDVGEEADHLFSEVLAGRNELMDSLRRRKQ